MDLQQSAVEDGITPENTDYDRFGVMGWLWHGGLTWKAKLSKCMIKAQLV